MCLSLPRQGATIGGDHVNLNCVSREIERKLQEMVRDREGWRGAVHGVQRARHDLVTEQ